MNNLRAIGICGTTSLLLVLSACLTVTQTPSAAQELLMAPPVCEACDQATVSVALTQQQINADSQAAATAEIVRANAQAILNSANATLGAVQTQDQNNANSLAAQIAATAEIVRANAQATMDSAGSTQNAALTQDAIRQTQMADMATTGAQALLIEQNKAELAARTQTAMADNIATQTQVAAATSQWYIDQTRQREEQRQGPIGFLWMWCFPVFIFLLAGLVLWGVWHWLRIQQASQPTRETPVGELPAKTAEVRHHRDDDPVPYLESDIDSGYQVTTPDDQVRKWVDEVKSKLNDSDKKNENENTDQ